MNRYIISNNKEKQNAKLESVGGKALHLISMQEAGLAVPEFVILSTDLVNRILAPVRNNIETLCSKLNLEDKKELIDISNHLQEIIGSIQIPSEIKNQIHRACVEKFNKDYLISVRSSAIAEDSSKLSYAGQHKSYLYVNQDNIFSYIIKSIASAWSLSALSYRLLNGESIQEISIAIVLQQMIFAKKSGVAFTRNPGGNLDETLIVAGYGLGEGVVSEKVDTDSYSVNRSTEDIRSNVVEKKSKLVYDHANASIINTSTTKSESGNAVLNKDEIMLVYRLALKCESLLNSPADIEFAYDEKDRLFILQMRAITSINFEDIKILDNTNIVESFPDISSPLTFSFAVNAYKNVFKNIGAAFWISSKTIEKNKYLFENLIAHYKGRIYYRLDNWYKMMAIVHPSKKSLKAWENAVGLKSSNNIKQHSSIIHRIKIALSIIGLLLRYKTNNKTFYKEFEKNYELLKSYINKNHSAKELWTRYQNVSERLFKPWHQTLINDFISFKAFSLLQNLSLKYGISDKKEYANDLLCGTTGVSSAEAVMEMLSIKDMILNSRNYKELFELSVDEIMTYYDAEKYKKLFDSIKNYISKYGDRTLEELKLETPTLRHDPKRFIKLLKNQLHTSSGLSDFINTQNEISKKAVQQYTNKLKWYNPRRYIFKKVHSLAAYGLRNRENMRFCRTRAYGLVKDIFLEIGDMMVAAGVINNKRDIFYLTIHDLEDFCMNDNRESKVDDIEKTKQIYKDYERENLPDRIIYTGDKIEEIFRPDTTGNKTFLQNFEGIAVSKGKVEGEAIVIKKASFDISVANRIMISKITDPGWVFLMAQSSGIISEKGSLLSHTAIVGRELGIPVVVGIANATNIFHTGDLIALDGDNGKVSLIKKA